MSYDLTEMFAEGLAYGRSDEEEVQDVLAAGAGEFDAKYTWDRDAILRALAQLAPSINTEATQPYAEPITDWKAKNASTISQARKAVRSMRRPLRIKLNTRCAPAHLRLRLNRL